MLLSALRGEPGLPARAVTVYHQPCTGGERRLVWRYERHFVGDLFGPSHGSQFTFVVTLV